MIIARKLKLSVIGDKNEVNRVFQYIRDEQYNQYRGLNLAMSYLATADMIQNFESSEERKLTKKKEGLLKKIDSPKKNEDITLLYNELEDIEGRLSEIQTNEIDLSQILKERYTKDLYNALKVIEFQQQDLASLITQRVRKDFNTISGEFKRGERSLTNYRRDFPLMCRGRDLKFYHDLSSSSEIEEHYLRGDFKVYIRWIKDMTFKVNLGRPLKSNETRHSIKRILTGEYKVCDSSFEIENNKIILNLSLEIPDIKTIELDENTVVGVDIGVAIPAVVALNNNKYTKKFIGSMDDFLRVRTKIQSQLRAEQKKSVSNKGGHGRKRKLKDINRFKEKERNFVKSYNHFLSKNIVDFALKNRAKYINMEKLSKDSFQRDIMRNRSYFELQSMVKYKAQKYGIIVRFTVPYLSSQKCSDCGHSKEGQRLSQSEFKCKSCGYEVNADFNSARNIASSVEFL